MATLMRSRDYDYLAAFLSLGILVVMTVMPQQFADNHRLGVPKPIGGTKVAIDPREDPAGHVKQARKKLLDERFQQAVVMLHAKKFDMAVTALHKVLEIAPKLPEAHLNMGYALFGLKNYGAARDFFNTAIELAPYSANAYYGLAETYEATKDYEAAIGAMRTYVHLSGDSPDAVRFKVKGEAAIWEWQLKLGRLPPPPKTGAVPFPGGK